MEKVSFDIILNLKNNISGALAKVNRQFKDIEKSAEEAGSTTKRLANICGKLKLPDLNAFLGIADRLGSVVGDLSQEGLGFGQSMADLSAITGITGAELESLRENARQVGKDSGLGADTMARAYAVLASQIDVATIGMEGLNRLQQESVLLAQASGMGIDAAAMSLAGTINQFGLSADEASRVVNVLAAGSKYGAAEVSELAQSFKVVGSAASAMGLTVEQSAGALEVLSKANLKGSEAGTALRNIILKLTTELGVDLSKTSLSTALDALKPRLTDAAYLSKLFGVENIAAAQYLIQNASAVEEMTRKVTGTNVAQEQAAVRTETTAHKMEILRAKVNDIKIGVTDMLGPLSAYAAIMGENAVVLASFYQLGGGMVSVLRKYHLAAKAAAVAQLSYNSAVAFGRRILYVYQMQVLTARAAIVSTTGATRLMNVAIAASPYVLAAAAAVALGVAIYKVATRSSEAAAAQKRLNGVMADMEKESAAERLRLDGLFEELYKAKEGTEGWYAAREKIVSRYGEYLDRLGIEIKDVDTARVAYGKLSRAILDTARSRAMEKASQGAAEAMADTEGKVLGIIREQIYSHIGPGEGQITAREAGKAFAQIRGAVRSGKDIPEEASLILGKLQEVIRNPEGRAYVGNPTEEYILLQVERVRKARQAYEGEIANAKAMFGGATDLDSPSPKVSSTTPAVSTPAATPKTGPDIQSLTLEEIRKKVEELQAAQQKASVEEGKNLQTQINALEKVKKARELAMGIGADKMPAAGSLDTMKRDLSKLEKELSTQPVGEASIRLQMDIDKLKQQIEGVKVWIENEAFRQTHGELKVDIVPTLKGGRSLQEMAEDMQKEESRKNPEKVPSMLTPRYVRQMKLPPVELPRLEPKKSGFEQWNEAVDRAYQKNQDMVESMGAIGGAMGNLGRSVGGAAGEWLNWGGSVVQAVSTAIPQMMALMGVQRSKVAANTAEAGSAAASSQAGIPFVGPVLAVAAMASVVAALASLPKFADGGIAYGPTYALFGEYAGARNNPEVVAPLSKLRAMLQPVTGGTDGDVRFIIKGRNLWGVLERENKVRQRTH